VIPSAYRAPRWLPGRHLQTIYPYLFRRLPLPALRRERWDTPDHDFVDADWLDGPVHAPVVVLFHGLEGNSRSHYARAFLQQARRRRWRVVIPHFRGCSGTPNLLPRAYHSGDHEEIDWIMRRIAEAQPNARRYAMGVSLGGNALLKWLALSSKAANEVIHRAAVVSAPMDLITAGHRLGRGVNFIYTWNFLRTLKRKSIAKLSRYPSLYDRSAVSSALTLHRFDDLVTAPMHGFLNADEYWRTASTRGQLREITVPTLLIHARNDPFLPGKFLPRPSEVARCVELEFPPHGGHVGFVSGAFPGHLDWMPQRVMDFFSQSTGSPPGVSQSVAEAMG
jgi:predicted alpha/beta-fold hydrolase